MAGRLVVVGLGIQVARHVTWEGRRAIERADRLLYLAGNPSTEAWLRGLQPRAESLATSYVEGGPRTEAYADMVRRMLEPVREGFGVCAAFYGHPGVFVHPSHEAIRRARSEGFDARMLPGISAEDCLFADLGIDPARSGWQSYEATDFLVNDRRIDPRSSLILWQVGMVGRIEYRPEGFRENRNALAILRDALVSRYSAGHEAVLYEASPYAVVEPFVERLPLHRLTETELTPASTLYVPPLPSSVNDEMLARLGIDRAQLPRLPPCWEATPPSPGRPE